MRIDNKFSESFKDYRQNMSDEYVEIVHSYVIHGLHPGGMFSSIFANDVLLAVQRSHPCNSWEQLAIIMKWIGTYAPFQCYGSYDKINEWCKLDIDTRDKILFECDLKDTVFDIIKEPI